MGNEIPQARGCGTPIHAASLTDEKSTMPRQMLMMNPTIRAISGAAPWIKPLPKTLSTRVMRNVMPASARNMGSP